MKRAGRVRLGVNIDHVATVRNARGGRTPDPVRAARLAIEAGADSITAHLREDRRHISDTDIARLKSEIHAPLNLEMAATEEMIAIAEAARPHAACLVPERRAELTTEGGLNVASAGAALPLAVSRLTRAGIRVSLFIDPDLRQIEAAARVMAPVIELHTGAYCEAWISGDKQETAFEMDRLRKGAALAKSLGLEVHAGHGLDFDTAAHLAALPEIQELNIGHFLIGEAIFAGLAAAVARMRTAIARGECNGQGAA